MSLILQYILIGLFTLAGIIYLLRKFMVKTKTNKMACHGHCGCDKPTSNYSDKK